MDSQHREMDKNVAAENHDSLLLCSENVDGNELRHYLWSYWASC
jgi:hypothetical protein